MWQSILLAGIVWTMGSLIKHTGYWLCDKTIKLPFGGVLVGIGSLLEFAAMFVLLTIDV